MCIFGRTPRTPTPPPLAPPPPAPEPPPPPIPEPEPLVTEVNPKVQRTRTKKDKNPQLKGTSALRIPLGDNVNTSGQMGGGNY